MKKILAIIVALVVSCTLSVFAAGGNEDDGEITIGFANFFAGVNAYTSTYTQRFEELVDSTEGVSAISLDAQGNPSTQLDHMNDLIAKDVDVILLWPVDGSAIIPALRQASQAGIPVLVTNSPVDESAYEFIVGFTGPNNLEEGRLAGELMVEGLGGAGNVVELTGTPGYVTSLERSQGFLEAISGHPDIVLLDSQPCNWDREKAQEVMENFLVKYPDIDGVYACDSGAAQGAIAAIKAAGRAIGPPNGIIVTDATLFRDGYDSIVAGEAYGSVLQSPVVDAELAFETAVKVANGEEIDFFNYMETPKVNQDNVLDFERPVF